MRWLNYLFFALLSSIGFEIKIISVQVFNGKNYGPEFDHLLLLTEIDNQLFIIDIGFGDSFQTPLAIQKHPDRNTAYPGYKIVQNGIFYTVQQKRGNQQYRPQYQFTLNIYNISDFAKMCIYRQTSPASHFT
ncbi:arylamine N-acetyltransferase [Iodobacter ciconiae]|uniref:Arylamine N-acetyltransferase n=1 Tax=Iodobacter ciconiae TaxID=2496266 RepID=A0A3S8ZRF4_9NEIS|nr:hypothetical protein EJO50_06005 [Iodobacter ciconiae]